MGFLLEPTKNKGEYKVSVDGNLDIYTLPSWKKIIVNNIKEIEILVLDLENLKDLDSAAIQALIITKNYFRKLKKKFIIINHTVSFLTYLDTFGLVGFMEDKIQISQKEKENYKFNYGMKKVPGILRK